MTTTTTARRTGHATVVTAVVAVASLVLLIRFALHSGRGQRWDTSAMDTVVGGRDTQLTVLSVLGNVSIGMIVVVLAGCTVVAFLRGRAHLALAAAAVIGGANLTTQVLKHSLLERPDIGLGSLNSLPSGHTTVVASAVGAVLLVAPGASRPILAAAGGFATTLTGASTIVAGWHRPSDVLAALAVSLAWTAVAAWFVRGRPGSVAGPFAGAVAGCFAALAFLVLVGVRPVLGWDGFIQSGLVLGGVTAATAVFVLAASAVSPAE